MEKNSMSLDELKSSYTDLSKKVRTLWKAGVKSKLNLAKEIANSYLMVLYVGDALEEARDIHSEFLEGLPFGTTTIGKFKRIASAKWLYEMDAGNLPNDYNTLDALASAKVVDDKVVVKYMKENISPDTGRGDISDMVKSALREEEARKNRSRYEPDPKKDGVINELREDGDPLKEETSENGSGEDTTEGGKVKPTAIVTIKIDKDRFAKDRGVLMDLVASIGRITAFLTEEIGKDSGFEVEENAKVVVALLKKIESAEAKARSKAYDEYSIRDIAA